MALRENRAANRFKYVTFFNVSKTEKQNYKANFKKKIIVFQKVQKKCQKKIKLFLREDELHAKKV